MGSGQHPQHDCALGDEKPMPADQVAFADGVKLCDARIIRILDPDDLARGSAHWPVVTDTSATIRPVAISKMNTF